MSISYACGAMIWLMMFNPTAGLINSVIGKPISWSGDRIHAMLMIIITTCWLTAGMNFIYVLSGLDHHDRKVGSRWHGPDPVPVCRSSRPRDAGSIAGSVS